MAFCVTLSDRLLGMFGNARTRVALGVIGAAVLMPVIAQAQITIPAANLGTDGNFAPFTNRTVTLDTAVTGTWDQPGNSRGVYDAAKWAVVYKYSSVSIPAGVTVNFSRHSSGAPVVWLVSGDVIINGTLNLNGAGHGNAGTPGFTLGGPGGFSGGAGVHPMTGGRGPGGGNTAGSRGEGGGFGTFGGTNVVGEVGGYVYGTADLVPLIGGSGGGGGAGGNGFIQGGGGGGGILIVSTGTITVNGTIVANGGNGFVEAGGGSGGGIRLVSNTVTGTGTISAVGGGGFGFGGFGRIRTETNNDTLITDGNPSRNRGTVGLIARLWPETTEPRVTAVSLGNKPVPTDPRGSLSFGATDVELNSLTPANLVITTANVPVSATVEVRIVPLTQGQQETRVPATFQSGNLGSASWSATLPITNGVSSFTVSVIMP